MIDMSYDYARDYFVWLYDTVSEGRYPSGVSYMKLLGHLHHKKFRYSVRRDENRAEDGKELRRRFAHERIRVRHAAEIERCLRGPCSVLEMMVALAIRCEETIMDDPRIGDRTQQWFWHMIVNMGLGSMMDDRYDEDYVDEVVERFLDRDYEPDGRGGLVTINDCEYDLRVVEIWHQLLWYLDTIT